MGNKWFQKCVWGGVRRIRSALLGTYDYICIPAILQHQFLNDDTNPKSRF